MRLGAVGTLVWDRIWHPSGGTPGAAPMEQWGGAVYSLSGLSAACPAGWQILPIMKVGRDLADEAHTFLSSLPHLDLSSGLRVVSEPNNRVELRYLDLDHRREIQTGGVPGWSWEDLRPLLPSVSALYVNFLSGFELDLEAALRLRREFSGPIYGDLHSLFLSAPGEAPRAPRPLPDWETWLRCFDVVQLNETELSLLGGGGVENLSDLLSYGPSVIVTTLGGAGASFAVRAGLPADPLCWRAHSAVTAATGHVPPSQGALRGDPTGCGDVWGSVFFSGLLARFPVRQAMERAHCAAATKIRHPSTAELHHRLRDALCTPDPV